MLRCLFLLCTALSRTLLGKYLAINLADEWDADFLAVQAQLDALDECIPPHVKLHQYRRWCDFQEMIEAACIRFRRADTYNRKGVKEGIVHERVRQAFSGPDDHKDAQDAQTREIPIHFLLYEE